MFRLGRFLLAVATLFPGSLALAQGGAGGYGQGGAPGGFGGGGLGGGGRGGIGGGYMGDVASPSPEKRRPDEDESRGIWESRTAILTPGDRVEFKLKMKKGETLFAAATSDAFDPALSVEDAKATVLAKNDDRADGDQSPFLIYRFPADGTYVLKVLSYRSVSGGKFTMKMRTFMAEDAPLGPAVHDEVESSNPDRENRVVFRLSAKKDKIYDLRTLIGLRPYASQHALMRLVGPTGVEATDFVMIPTGDYTPVFLATADGDYYAEYESSGETRFKTDFREVPVTAAKPTDAAEFDMAPGDLRVVEFPVKPDRIVRTTLTGASLVHAMSAPAGTGRGNGEDDAYGNNPSWTWFRMNRDSDDDLVRVFHGDGIARMAIRSRAATPQKVTLKNVESLPTWETGEALKSAINIGDSRLFVMKSGKSELMKVFAGASHFQPRLDIFRLDGERANSLCDRKTHTASDDLYFPEEGTFLVRLCCDGHGGSGDFLMKRDSLTPIPYAMGTAQALKLDGSNFGLFSVNLEAGKRYQLMTDEPGRFLRADLLDDDGQFLTSQVIRFDKVIVQYFVPTRSGRHRLWLRGEPGERHFKFEPHVAPTIGG